MNQLSESWFIGIKKPDEVKWWHEKSDEMLCNMMNFGYLFNWCILI